MGPKSSKFKLKPKSEAEAALDKYLDLVVEGREPGHATVGEIRDLTQKVVKQFLERCLNVEMDEHLENCDNQIEDNPENDSAIARNKRNGYSEKTVTDGNTQVRIAIPRDRKSEFEPVIVGKYQRHIDGAGEKILSMYARGMSDREISAHMQEIYGVDVSAETISRVTDSVLKDVTEWRNRPLDAVYPLVFFDALRIKIREDGQIKNKAMYLGMCVTARGTKDILGMWLSDNEGAGYWTQVFTDIKNRGCNDILIAVTDGLKGMTEAIEKVYPNTVHQTCIVHLIRNSAAYVPYKNLKNVTAKLKEIYGAATQEMAELKLSEFEGDALGRKYPAVVKLWRDAWPKVAPMFRFPLEVRRLIYTTNAIEGLNRSIRKVIKTRTCFPSDEAAYKLVWLALNNITRKWSMPVHKWKEAVQQFSILFPGRFEPEV